MSAGIYRGPERFVPKLIFASASGRTEISTRPDGAIRIDLVAERKDEIAPDEVARLIARLTAWQEEAVGEQTSVRITERSDGAVEFRIPTGYAIEQDES